MATSKQNRDALQGLQRQSDVVRLTKERDGLQAEFDALIATGPNLTPEQLVKAEELNKQIGEKNKSIGGKSHKRTKKAQA